MAKLKKIKKKLASSTASPKKYGIIRETVDTIVVAVVFWAIIKTFIIQSFYIPTGSMMDTLKPHDRIMVNKFYYRFKSPARFDVIVFKSPEKPYIDFIKRVIGLPGDLLERKHGHLYINGKKIEEPFIKDIYYLDVLQFFSEMAKNYIKVPGAGTTYDLEGEDRMLGIIVAKYDGHKVDIKKDGSVLIDGKKAKYYIAEKDYLFMMGDNRNNSRDSRFWGPLPVDYIRGKALIKIWPLHRFGLIR